MMVFLPDAGAARADDPPAPDPVPDPTQCARALATMGKAQAKANRAAILANTRAMRARQGLAPDPRLGAA